MQAKDNKADYDKLERASLISYTKKTFLVLSQGGFKVQDSALSLRRYRALFLRRYRALFLRFLLTWLLRLLWGVFFALPLSCDDLWFLHPTMPTGPLHSLVPPWCFG